MDKKHENAVWVPHADTLPEQAAPGVTRRILAYNKGLMCVCFWGIASCPCSRNQ